MEFYISFSLKKIGQILEAYLNKDIQYSVFFTVISSCYVSPKNLENRRYVRGKFEW